MAVLCEVQDLDVETGNRQTNNLCPFHFLLDAFVLFLLTSSEVKTTGYACNSRVRPVSQKNTLKKSETH